MKEIWMDILGFETLYQVSNRGRVKSLHRIVKRGKIGDKCIPEKIKSQSVHYKNGYLSVMLNREGVEYRKLVHRLVGEVFLENKTNKRTINHKDGDRNNNFVSNLEWATDSENQKHSYDTLKRIRTWDGRGSNLNKKIKCLTNGVIYDSLTTASIILNISTSGICSVLKGYKKKIKGFVFEYQP